MMMGISTASSIIAIILGCGAITAAAVLVLLAITILLALYGKNGSSKKKSEKSTTPDHANTPSSKDGSRTRRIPQKKISGNSAPFICLGVFTIIVVLLLVLTSFTGALFFIALKMSQDDRGSLNIDSLSSEIVEPLTLLRIEGSGFDPEHSAISVVFLADHRLPLTYPATYAEEGFVEVVVPPYTGRNLSSSGIFDVKVIQISNERVMISNVLEGLKIKPMLKVNSSIEPGVHTGLFLSVCLESLDAMLLNSTDSDLTQAILEQKGRLMDVMNQLDRDMAQGSRWLNLSGEEVNITELDMLIFNMVHNMVGSFPEEINDPERTRADTGRPEDDPKKMYDKIRNVDVYKSKDPGILIESGAKLIFGTFMTVLCMAGGAGIGMSFTAGLVFAIGTSWLFQMASGEDPTPMGTLETALETILDGDSMVPVVGLLKGQLDFFKECNRFLERWYRYRDGEPRGGVAMNDWANMGPLSSGNKIVYKRSPGAHTQRLQISDEQSSIPFKDAIPPIPPGRIVYDGNFDGWATFYRSTTCPVCGPVVSEIRYYVVGIVTLTADVNDKGRMSGTLEVSGKWEASGTGGCSHINVQSTNGPLRSTQRISGSTSGFSAGSGSGEMVQGISGTMDPDTVYGEMTFQTTDGVFQVQYVLSVND